MCDITMCQLKNGDCLGKFYGIHLFVDGPPWTINAYNNVTEGYIASICYECSNGIQSISLENLTIT